MSPFSQLPRAPIAPLLLGGAGLIPFLALAILLLSGASEAIGVKPEAARVALATYGAIIASFLGGIRWGSALGRSDGRAALDYGLSVAPSLLAWACLALPRPWDLAALGGLILAWGLVDQDLVRRGVAPGWFGALRLALSGGAGLSLVAASLV